MPETLIIDDRQVNVYQTSKVDFDAWPARRQFMWSGPPNKGVYTFYFGDSRWVARQESTETMLPLNAKWADIPEIIITDEITGGRKGQKDVRLHALPWESLAELGRVYTYGENKYDDYNFRKGYKWSLSADALDRHFKAFWNREDRDGESGLHHLAHACWHCLTLLFFSLTGRGTDDRPT